MEFSYSQTENFEMEKLSSDTGYFKKTVEINRGNRKFPLNILEIYLKEIMKKDYALPIFAVIGERVWHKR